MKHQSALLLSVLLVLGLAHVSASPIGRVLSRLRKTAEAGCSSASCRRSRYIHLYATTHDLVTHHGNLYTDFKIERYPNVTNPRVYDMVLSYLPTTRNIPNRRENHSDEDLLLLHYDNLIIFKDTLNRVEETEAGNITATLTTVTERLSEVIRRLETAMMAVGLEYSIVRSQTTIPPFHTNVTTAEQNTRTLLVLQEFDGYIIEVLIDYTTLKTRSSTSVN